MDTDCSDVYSGAIVIQLNNMQAYADIQVWDIVKNIEKRLLSTKTAAIRLRN